MDCSAVDVDHEAIIQDDVFAGAWVIEVGHGAVDRGKVLAGTDAMDEGHDAIAEVCKATDVDHGACNTLDDGCKAIVEGCGDVDESDILAGNGVIDVGHKAIDRDVIFAGTCAVDEGHKAIGGRVFADARGNRIGCGSGVVSSSWRLGVGFEMRGAIDMDCSVVDEDGSLVHTVMSFP